MFCNIALQMVAGARGLVRPLSLRAARLQGGVVIRSFGFNQMRGVGERRVTHLLRVLRQGIDGLRCAYPSYAGFFCSALACCSSSPSIDLHKCQQGSAGSITIPVPKPITQLDGFEFTYLLSADLDACGKNDAGEKFRKILEEEYYICLIDEDYKGRGIFQLKKYLENQLRTIARVSHDGRINYMTCGGALTYPEVSHLAEITTETKDSEVISSLPRECKNLYFWFDKN